jgi:hypothetical protein
MKIQFSILHGLSLITIVAIAIFAWVSISALQSENESLARKLEETSKRLRLTERSLLIRMKDVLAQPPSPFSEHDIAKEVAQRIAIEYPNDQYIWWVLTKTDALYDGIPIDDALGMLGPPADQSDPQFMVWYDATDRTPLKLRASVDSGKLESWVMAHGFKD